MRSIGIESTHPSPSPAPVVLSREILLRGRLSTINLLELTSLDELVYKFKFKLFIFLFFKTSYLNEEVNCTELSPQLVFPVVSKSVKCGADHTLPASLMAAGDFWSGRFVSVRHRLFVVSRM
jgi:hypothetical protein